MCNTTKSHKNAMLFVQEMTQLAGGSVDVAFATWCVGPKIGDTFYMFQVSESNLLADDEILVIKEKACLRMPVMLAGFTQHTFSTEPDQLPRENRDLKFVNVCDLPENILEAIDSVHNDYLTCWVA